MDSRSHPFVFRTIEGPIHTNGHKDRFYALFIPLSSSLPHRFRTPYPPGRCGAPDGLSRLAPRAQNHLLALRVHLRCENLWLTCVPLRHVQPVSRVLDVAFSRALKMPLSLRGVAGPCELRLTHTFLLTIWGVKGWYSDSCSCVVRERGVVRHTNRWDTDLCPIFHWVKNSRDYVPMRPPQ